MAVTAPARSERRTIQLVIAASAMGTAFEWYDFYIYGTLAALFGKLFFPASNPAAGFLLALATFGVGFAVRPIGAAIFGAMGDRFGRKYSFLVTITLMGVATAAIGLLPTYATIGIAAPVLLVTLRALQGLAVGGEYGGAAIYVAEHAPANRRGAYTGFIQIGASAGFMLSLTVVLAVSTLVGEPAWSAWGWRLPFLFSLVLLGISIWVRLKLSESPAFKALKEAGEVSRNPVRESFATPARVRRLFAVMIGIAAGQSIVGYIPLFQALTFLQVLQHVDPTVTRIILIIASLCGAVITLGVGALSDRLGRKRLVLLGYGLFLLCIFPTFHFMAERANPALSQAVATQPVVVTGSDCGYDPFALGGQPTACGKLLDALSKTGVPYAKVDAATGAAPAVTIGGQAVDATQPALLNAALAKAGYVRSPVTPPLDAIILIWLAVLLLFLFSALTYGPVGSWMVELFPARIRYSSLAISYNVGVGIFAGFMPFIVQYIIARTGDPFAGFWYPFGMTVLALIVAAVALPETAGKQLE